VRRVRHHDRALRILYAVHKTEYYLRDLGGRWLAASHTVRGLEGVEALLDHARKKYAGETVMITAKVASGAIETDIDLLRVRCTPPPGIGLFAGWLDMMKTSIRQRLQDLEYVTGEEFDAIRAILDAGELGSVPEFLTSLVLVKSAG
jgi:hypothetical protein